MPEQQMPDWSEIVRDRLTELQLKGAAEEDLCSELALHLEDRYRELLTSGIEEREARRLTLMELDETQPLASARRAYRPSAEIPAGTPALRGNWLDDLRRDLGFAFRTMRKAPLFVLFVVATLALGIGANTTVFTVINTLLLNPLPVPDSATLAGVGETHTNQTARNGLTLPISHADLVDYQMRNSVFTSLAGYTSPAVLTFQEHNASERLFGELVTGNYFQTLGLVPARGRFFLPEEDSAPGAHPVAVMNYGTWRSRFGGDPNIIGKMVRLNGLTFHIIGIAPPRFIGLNAIFGPDLWIPAAMMEQLFPNQMRAALTDRSKAFFHAAGRLKLGTTLAAGQANLRAIAGDLARAYPESHEGLTVSVLPIRNVLFGSSQQMASGVYVATFGLLAVVGIVLLIACSNVANLLLARAASRQQEIAVRLAIGASRTRLIRQLLTESVLLALLSGIFGLAIGWGGLRLLFSSLPASANFIAPKFDLTVFLFALVISVGTGFVFGLIPALKASRTDLAEALKEEARTVGKSRRKVNLANTLLAGQVAFSFLLLVIAALFLRSIGRAYAMDPGFQIAHLDVFMTTPGQAGYSQARTKAYYKEASERVARLPGVTSLGWSSNLPLWANPVNGLEIPGRVKRSRADTLSSIVLTIDLEYFHASGVRLDRGRTFDTRDSNDSLPVAIVNEKLAHEFWPNGDALGKPIQAPGEKFQRQIVGIAHDASYTSWSEAPQLCVYLPLEQHFVDGMTLYVRTEADPAPLIAPIEGQLRAAGPQVLDDARTGKQIADGGLFQVRIGVALLTLFGVLALGLASIGLYGILAYGVEQRKREIGLRMALGAGRAGVLALILRQGMSLVGVGAAVGLLAALVIARMISGMLYGVNSGDLLSISGAALVLLVVAAAACYLPARWASRVDPLTALREG